MGLPCHVFMEEQGSVGEDDGSSAWHKTAVSLLVVGRVVKANVLTDGYSGRQTLRVVHDDFALDRQAAKTLLLAVYNVASVSMRMCSCDIGEAFLDLEKPIRDLFYGAVAESLVRQIRAAPSLPCLPPKEN